MCGHYLETTLRLRDSLDLIGLSVDKVVLVANQGNRSEASRRAIWNSTLDTLLHFKGASMLQMPASSADLSSGYQTDAILPRKQ